MNTNKTEIPELDTNPEKNTANRSTIRHWGSHVLAIIMQPNLKPETDPEQDYANQVDHFLSPRTSLETGHQLRLMTKFWDRLGFNLPPLSQSQQTTLSRTAANYPRYRVLPTPLLSTLDRQSLTGRASNLNPIRPLSVGYTPTIKPGRDLYGLRYKTPAGQIVNRDDYIAALMTAGQAVEAPDGTAWVFPLTDVGLGRKDLWARTLADLYESAGPLSCPETIMAIQLLRAAAGRPNRRCEVVISNEALYRLDGFPNSDKPERVIGVDWDPNSGIGLDPLVPTDTVDRLCYGVRTVSCDAVSGL